MAASSASAVGSMDCFALPRGRPGTCAARTQLVLLSSIASTSVLSKSRAIGWERVSDDCAMTQILQRVLTGGHSNCSPLALMGSIPLAPQELVVKGEDSGLKLSVRRSIH